MANKGAQRRLGATDSGPKPGSYALGSVESRVAARAMLDAREAIEVARVPGILVRFISPGVPIDESKCTCKRLKAGTIGFCRCFSGEPDGAGRGISTVSS